MEVYLKSIDLYEDTYAYMYRATEEENAQVFKESIKEYVKNIAEVVDADFDKLTGFELYQLLKKVYWIDLEKDDYLEILSKKHNRKYDRVSIIYSRKTFNDIVSEGHGKNFSYWQETFQVYYNVALAKGVKLEARCYTNEEIQKMIDVKDIIVVGSSSRKIGNVENIDCKDYYHENFEYDDSFDGFDSNILYDNLEIFGNILREKFTKKKIQKNMLKLLDQIQEQMDDIYIYLDENHDKYRYYDEHNTAVLCKAWFDSSEEKKEYKRIRKKLNGK